MSRIAHFVLLTLLIGGCGGRTDADGAGVAGAGGTGAVPADSGTGGTGGAAGATDGGWTDCSTPDFAVCGVGCPEGRPDCTVCFPPPTPEKFGICGESLNPDELSNKPADGRVLATTKAVLTAEVPSLAEVAFSGGLFLLQHGQGDRVAYADRGLFTGAPLPEPSACPSLSAGQVCGGLCGGCPVGQICTGRSPLHPFGICVTDDLNECRHPPEKNWTCSSTKSCFVFTVEAERQALANRTGFCLPKATCESYRTLPGGGECY